MTSNDGIEGSVKYLQKKKCDHAPEMRTFKLLSAATTFEKLESQFLCNTDSLLEISLAKNEEGPWTTLEDSSIGGSDMYQASIGLILQQVLLKYLAILVSVFHTSVFIQSKKDFFRIREICPNLICSLSAFPHFRYPGPEENMKQPRLGGTMPKSLVGLPIL